MVLYNTSELDEAKNFYEITIALNNLSGGLIASLFLGVFCLFLVVLFRNTGDMSKVFLGSSFITTIVALLFWASGLIGINVLIFPVVLLMIAIFINIWGG